MSILDAAAAANDVADALDARGAYAPQTYARADAVAARLRQLARVAIAAADLRECWEHGRAASSLVIAEFEAALNDA